MKKLLSKKNVTITFQGTKKIKGIDTGKKCLVVGVSLKEDLKNLKEEDQIPSILEDGTLTDVVIFPKIKALASCPNNTTTACYPHAERYRPFQMGVSIGASDLVNAGTLGAFVIDNTDSKICVLTCNHVLGPVYNMSYSVPSNGVLLPSVLDLVQPGVYDGGQPIIDVVGVGKRANFLQFGAGGLNTVDAIICDLNTINLQSAGILEFLFPASFQFAEKLEYSISNTVYKIGRTTGQTEATIYGTDSDINVEYPPGGANNIAIFENQIMLYSPTRFISSGDSGSVILFKSGGKYKIIGLLFAASEDGLYGFANHIADVADELDISAWDGSLSMANVEDDYIKVDNICYSRSSLLTFRPVSGTKEGTYNNCLECLGSSKQILFGNVL